MVAAVADSGSPSGSSMRKTDEDRLVSKTVPPHRRLTQSTEVVTDADIKSSSFKSSLEVPTVYPHVVYLAELCEALLLRRGDRVFKRNLKRRIKGMLGDEDATRSKYSTHLMHCTRVVWDMFQHVVTQHHIESGLIERYISDVGDHVRTRLRAQVRADVTSARCRSKALLQRALGRKVENTKLSREVALVLEEEPQQPMTLE